MGEWISHYERLGSITIYNNGDDIDAIHKKNIEVIPWPGKVVQLTAYMDMCKRYPNDVIAFLDADEFLITHHAVETLEYLVDKFGALCFNWKTFGSSGLIEHDDRPQQEKFTKHLPEQHLINHHIKTIALGSNIKRFINPHQVELHKGGYHREVLNGLSTEVDYSLGYINHYFTRSRNDFIVKCGKGRVDIETIDRTMAEMEAVDKDCI